MGYFGKTTPGTTLSTNALDTVRVTRLTMPERGRLGHLSARLAGGGGVSDQTLRPVVYKAPLGALAAYGDPLVVKAGQAEGWVELRFPDAPLLNAGDYDIGLQFGPGDAAQWSYTTTTGTPTATVADTFADGPAASFPGGSSTSARSYAIWGHYRAADDLPAAATDDWIASLGFLSAQEVFSSTPVVPGSAVSANCGWHGYTFDDAIGSRAIVRTDGPLADLVGERLRVSAGGNEVYVYCHDERDIVEDISLGRRAFLALAVLSSSDLAVTVEVMT